MRQFIPFEDEWDVLERVGLDALVPYRLGLAGASGFQPVPREAQRTGPMAPSMDSVSPIRASMRRAVPADTSST